MDLAKFLPKNQEKDTYEYFWSLVIEPGWVQAGIWRIEKDEAQVNFSGIPIAWASEDDLVSSTDSALSAAIQNLPDNTPEPTKTVFGVVSSWVEGGQIKAEHLDKIKTICAELSLKPVGFVVISEAVAHFVKTEEGSPVSAIIVGVYKENIELSVFNLGNLLGTTKIARSVSFTDDIAEGLSRFSGSQSLPSRFIMYDGREGEIEEARQTLITANWDNHENIKFLHTPKVEVVESKEKLKAICLAGASEMAEVNKVSSMEETDETLPAESAKPEASPEAFGFTVNTNNLSDEALQNNSGKADGVQQIDESHQNIEPVNSISDVNPTPIVKPTFAKKLPIKPFLGKTSNIFKKFKFGGRKLNFGNTPLVAGFIVLIVIIVGGFASWWLLPSATVTIFVSPKTLNENFEAVIGDSVSNDSVKIIPSRSEKISVEGDLAVNTTGVKTVGDKAKGQVTIFRAGTSMTLPASTILKGPDNMQFSIDEAVNLASGSASSPSSTKVNVTAANIGASYNLSSGTSFSVGSYSLGDLEAKNESAFTGGSSREVNVVSEDDLENIEDELLEKLKEKAKTELREKIGDGEDLVETSLISKVEGKKFSGKVGDEASTLKLDLGMEIEAFVVKRSEVAKVAMEYLKDKVPSGFILKENNIETKFEPVGDGSEKKYKISVVANLLPDVNLDDIARKIIGKYPEVAKSYMSKNVPGFSGVEFQQKPQLPGKLGTLPHVYKNLEMELSAQK